ncbi:MAG: hypothetical protein JJU36_13205 [Phycisphaeraceae bacterium]|nr:hypothetical protein [Phycisphaeraceae bacterium]
MGASLATLEFSLISGLVGLIVLPVGLLGVLSYIMLRSRVLGVNGRPDNFQGLRLGLHYLMSVAILTGLAGLTMALAGQLTLKDGWAWHAETRRALSIVLAATLFAGACKWLLWARTNDATLPRINRTFVNIRLVLIGLAALTAFAGALGSGLAGVHGWHAEAPLTFTSGVLVWVPAWVVHLWLALRLARRPDDLSSLRLCMRCGYDLSGLRMDVGGRCPECGFVPPAAPSRPSGPEAQSSRDASIVASETAPMPADTTRTSEDESTRNQPPT